MFTYIFAFPPVVSTSRFLRAILDALTSSLQASSEFAHGHSRTGKFA